MFKDVRVWVFICKYSCVRFVVYASHFWGYLCILFFVASILFFVGIIEFYVYVAYYVI